MQTEPRYPAANRRMALGIPWRLPFYQALNGAHPLVESFIQDSPHVQPVPCAPVASRDPAQLAGLMPLLCRRTRHLTETQRNDYLPRIDPFEQASIDAQSDGFDALFTHTTPFYLGARPWIFHFESVPSLFHPFAMTGTTRGIVLRDHGFFQAVSEAFAASSCRAIFTHMHSSRQMLQGLLADPGISAKLHYVPLGVPALDDATALAKFDGAGPLRVLFTNSLHQNPMSFFLRGGHLLLQACGHLRAQGVPVELTIISSAAEGMGLAAGGGRIDGLHWITHRVSDAALEQMLREHHVFALPAVGLHSYSLLRALAHGCVPIVSDALGYEEYTRDIADSVFTVRGVRDLAYREEPEGWISDYYPPYIEAMRALLPQVTRALQVAQDRRLLCQMAQRNLAHCRSRHDPAVSQRAFADCIRPQVARASAAAPDAPVAAERQAALA